MESLSSISHEEQNKYGITDESKLAFNRYTNFLLTGDDSISKPELLNFLINDYSFLHPTAMRAEQVKLDDSEAAQAYFNNLNSIYEEFSRSFFVQSNEEDDNTVEEYSRNALSDYFFEASKGSYFGLGQIVALYIKDGEDPVRSMVENALRSESDSETVKSLLEARRKLINLYIQSISRSEQAGCIFDDSLNPSCARPIFDIVEKEVAELTTSINELETELRKEAITTLENIYYEFYPDEIIIEEGNSK